ncbi:accessory Sec system protein Asp2 [Aeromonas allosaccharophila]|uniref:accessory Sec system protein Asp2 n=1 Tax=Aeromonas allosaccharophila TaxID=656 RepID=UPI003D1CF004
MYHHEQTLTIDNVEISYLFQPAKQDRKHLVIIFSGFGSKSSVSYDFRGESAKSCRSNILWIKDSFSEECSYYLNTTHSDKVETSVYGLISYFINKLGIDKERCILVGFSKGGSAALYYGLKFGFFNILASCPQFHIGSYVKNNWPRVADNIIKDGNIDSIDNLLPSLLRDDLSTDKNIYLISSPNDLQYSSEIEPYLSYFYKYSNFNFVFTKSKLAWQHNKVTRYNLPIILSILYAHGEGVRPKFGLINNDEPCSSMDSVYLKALQEKNEVVTELLSCSIENSLLHIKGISFIKGYECPEYSKIKHTLILSGRNGCYRFPLGKNLNKEINYIYFENVYCDYSAAEFTTPGHRGIDISNIQRDIYTLHIEVECAGIVQIKKLETKKSFNTSYLIEGDEYYLGSFEGDVYIHRKDLLEEDKDKVFEISSKWHKGSLLHYEGTFAIRGINVSNWGGASYYVILKGEFNTYPFKIGMTELNNSSELFKDTYNIYKKSYFSTLGRKGIDISEVPQGNYDVFICMSHQGKTFSQKITEVLKWDGSEIEFTLDAKTIKKVAVIGSCVTRDNFNTKFNTDYKKGISALRYRINHR